MVSSMDTALAHCVMGLVMSAYNSNIADGGWSEWTEWDTFCAVVYTPVTFRRRKCDNPTQANGGRECEGPSYEEASCRELIWNRTGRH